MATSGDAGNDMATSGDAEHSSSVTEEFEYAYICLPCESDGHKVKAVGYCMNCREYLCQRCYDGHLIPSQMRRHVLLDEDHMAVIETDSKKSVCSERCPHHKEEVINYHCPTHSFFGCHICFYKHQKNCKDVLYIPEVSQSITSTKEFQEFNNRVTGISEKCTCLISQIKQQTETNDTCDNEAIAAMKEFKKEVLDAVDKLEKELLEKATDVKQQGTSKLRALAEKANAILKENQKIASKIDILLNKQQNCDLYTAMVQLRDKLLALEDELHAAEGDTHTLQFEFKSNKELLETLKSPFGLGKLCETGTITKVEHVIDINCKTGNDTSDCRLIGSVLLPNGNLIITDYNNYQVKLVDTRQLKIVADMKLSSSPICACQITDTQVAMPLCNEQRIVFVETNPSLSIARELKVDGSCRGVGYYEGKLVVSFNNSQKMEILDLQGTVLKKIETDDKGQSLFSNPYNLTINPYNKLIYVANYSGNNIVCMKLDGTVVAKYTDSELSGPWQVTYDRSGMVYICGRTCNNVHQITEDCKKVKVLLTNADGLSSPESVAYNQKDGKLFIGQASNNLKLYQVYYRNM